MKLLATFFALGFSALTAHASATPFFSSYISSGSNVVLEIYNPTCAPLDLASVQVERLDPSPESPFAPRPLPDQAPVEDRRFPLPVFGWGRRLSLQGSLAPLSSYVLCASPLKRPDGTPLCDRVTTLLNPAQAASYGLYVTSRLIDVLGGESDSQMLPPAANLTLVRNPFVLRGNPLWGQSDPLNAEHDKRPQEEGAVSFHSGSSALGFLPDDNEYSAFDFVTFSRLGCHHIDSPDPATCAGVSAPTCPGLTDSAVRSLRVKDLVASRPFPNPALYPCAISRTSSFEGESVTTYGVLTSFEPVQIARSDAPGLPDSIDHVLFVQDGSWAIKVMLNWASLSAETFPHASNRSLPSVGARLAVTGKIVGSNEEGVFLYATALRDLAKSSFARGIIAPLPSNPLPAALFGSEAQCSAVQSPFSPFFYQGRVVYLNDLPALSGSDWTPVVPLLTQSERVESSPIATFVDFRSGSWSARPLADQDLKIVTAPAEDFSFNSEQVLAMDGASQDGVTPDMIFMGLGERPVNGNVDIKGPDAMWAAAPSIRRSINALNMAGRNGRVPGLSADSVSVRAATAARLSNSNSTASNSTFASPCASLRALPSALDGSPTTVAGVVTSVAPGNSNFFLQSRTGGFGGLNVLLDAAQIGSFEEGRGFLPAIGDAIEVSGLLRIDPSSPFKARLANVTLITTLPADLVEPVFAVPVPAELFSKSPCSALALGLDETLIELPASALTASSSSPGLFLVRRPSAAAVPPARRLLQATASEPVVSGVLTYQPDGSFAFLPSATVDVSSLSAAEEGASSTNATSFIPPARPEDAVEIYQRCGNDGRTGILDSPWTMFGVGSACGITASLIILLVGYGVSQCLLNRKMKKSVRAVAKRDNIVINDRADGSGSEFSYDPAKNRVESNNFV